MEADRPFDITLSSNACLDIFPQNRPGFYKTRLERPITLNGAWEVGISDIVYRHNWNTLSRDCPIWFRIFRQHPELNKYTLARLVLRADSLSKDGLLPQYNAAFNEYHEIHAQEEDQMLDFDSNDDSYKPRPTTTLSESEARERLKQTTEAMKHKNIEYQDLRTEKERLERSVQNRQTEADSAALKLYQNNAIDRSIDHSNFGSEEFGQALQGFAARDILDPFAIFKHGIIPKGYYETAQSIGQRLSELFEECFRGTSFSKAKLNFVYDKVRRRAYLEVPPLNGVELEVKIITPDSYLLTDVLGFRVGYTNDNQSHTAYFYSAGGTSNKQPQLDVPQIIWIYSDIIKDQYVGNRKVPLLNKCPVQGAYDTQCYWCFNPLRFYPVTVSNLSEIAIKLTSGTSPDPIHIEDGDVVITLHLRRVGYI